MPISASGGSLGLTQSVSQALQNMVAMYGLKKTKQEIDMAKTKMQVMKMVLAAKDLEKEVAAASQPIKFIDPRTGMAIPEQAPAGGPGGQTGVQGVPNQAIPTNMQQQGNQDKILQMAQAMKNLQGTSLGGSPQGMVNQFAGSQYRLNKEGEPELVTKAELDKEQQAALKTGLEISKLQQEATPEGRAKLRQEELESKVAEKKALVKAEKEAQQEFLPQELEQKRREMEDKLSIEGLSGEKGTKISQSLTGKRGLGIAKNILLSEDSAGNVSLNRKVMLLAKSPQILQTGAKKITNLPIVKQISQQFGVDVSQEDIKNAQILRTHLRDAIDMRLRLATGATAPQSEIDNELNKFLASSLSDPVAVQSNLDQMESLFNTTQQLIDPSGFYSGKASGKEIDLDSLTVEQLEALYNSLGEK